MIALAMTLLGFSAAEPTRPPTQRIRLSAEDRAIYVQMITDGKAQREAEQKASGKRRRTGTVAGGSSRCDEPEDAVTCIEDAIPPEIYLDCELADQKRNWHPLKVNFTGGRRYFSKKDLGLSRSTPRVATVAADPNKLTRGLEFRRIYGEKLYFGETVMGSVKNGPYAVIENIGGWPLYSAVRLTSSDGPGSAAPNDYYTGFCDITYKLVGPLTPAEVREGKL